jgi:hypothetical protein
MWRIAIEVKTIGLAGGYLEQDSTANIVKPDDFYRSQCTLRPGA